MADCLYECLKEARLEKYYQNFVNGGLYHCEALLKLSMQDYPRYGVVLMEDRLRLFKLIQIVKSVQSEGLVCKHGCGNRVERNGRSQVQSGKIIKPVIVKESHHQPQKQHLGNLARPLQLAFPSQFQTAYNIQSNNPVNAPHHVATKSVTQVTYKPHSDSPIFHCRKTLKFTDSDVESDESEIDPIPHASDKVEGPQEQLRRVRNDHGDLMNKVQKPTEPRVSLAATAVSQYLENAVNMGTSSSVTSSLFTQNQQQEIFHHRDTESVYHNGADVEVSKTYQGDRDGGKHIKVNVDKHEDMKESSDEEMIIDVNGNRNNVKTVNNKENGNVGVVLQSPKQWTQPLQVSKETTLHVGDKFINIRKQPNKVNGSGDGWHSKIGDKTNDEFKMSYRVNASSAKVSKSQDLVSENTKKTGALASSKKVVSPKAFFIDASSHKRTSAASKSSLFTSESKETVVSETGQQPQHIIYRPLSSQEQQRHNMEQHSTHKSAHSKHHKAFHFKNFQPSSVIVNGQHSYFPTAATTPASTSTHQDSNPSSASSAGGSGRKNNSNSNYSSNHDISEKQVVYHSNKTDGYNYGVPGDGASQQQSSKDVQQQQQTVSTTAGTVNFTSRDDRGVNHNNGTSHVNGMMTALDSAKIRVCVRKRPLLNKEAKRSEVDIIKTRNNNEIIVEETKLSVSLAKVTNQHIFRFDEVFGASCNNQDVYSRTVKSLVQCVFNRGSATCFAFGQTGSGKSYTLLGNDNVPGLYQLAAKDIFGYMEKINNGRLHLWASYYEIYCSHLFDLLNKRKRLHVRENNRQKVCIAGLMETEVHSVKGLVEVVQYGNAVRVTGVSGANSQSSRSHAILQLEVRDHKDIKMGRMSFIDLAGSERATDMTDTSDRQTRIEGAEINQSLLALKECIRSLDQESKHTPYRQSKLTHILRDSFIGNSQTVMIANISPSLTSCVHTLNTLKYADRVKELRKGQENISPPKPFKAKITAQKLKNGQTNVKNGNSKATPASVSTQLSPPPQSVVTKNRQASVVTNKKYVEPLSVGKPQSDHLIMDKNKKPSPRDDNSPSDMETTPNKGMPVLFLGGQNGMQFASTPKMKGSPPEVGQVASPFDVSRILREENDTPIRGHKIIGHRTDDKNSPGAASQGELIGPRKLNFDDEIETENKQENPSNPSGDYMGLQKPPSSSSMTLERDNQNPRKKIYIGAEKVNELIRMQRERITSDDVMEEINRVRDVHSPIEMSSDYQDDHDNNVQQKRTESPETHRKRSKSSGRVLEARNNANGGAQHQRRSRSIDKVGQNGIKGNRDGSTSQNRRHNIKTAVNSQGSRSRLRSNDEGSSYPMKRHNEIMAEHKEVLDHLDSLLDRAKAAISESPLSNRKEIAPDSAAGGSNDGQESDHHHNNNNEKFVDKHLKGTLKKSVSVDGEGVKQNKGDEYHDLLPQSNVNCHQPEQKSSPHTSTGRDQVSKSRSIPSDMNSNANERGVSNERIQQVKEFTDHIRQQQQNSQQTLDSEVVIEYDPGQGDRVDSPQVSTAKVVPAPKHTFGPQEQRALIEKMQSERQLQRSNSQTSDKDSRNMSWHDILSNSNSESRSKDSSFNDRPHQHRLSSSNRTSRDISLEYVEDERPGYSSKAMIKDIDTVVIETSVVQPPAENGRSTVDSGIGTHRSHDLENELTSHSRGSQHSNNNSHSHRSSVETLDDLSLPNGNVASQHEDNNQLPESAADTSVHNVSIKVKYASSKKATSRLGLLQDHESSLVPPLKLNFDEEEDIDDYVVNKSSHGGNVRNAYSARETHHHRRPAINLQHSSKDGNVSKSARGHFEVDPRNLESSTGDIKTSQVPSSLLVHQDSAFSLVSDKTVSSSASNNDNNRVCAINNIEAGKTLTSKVALHTDTTSKINGSNFLPIQSFPVTSKVDTVVAAPSAVGKSIVPELSSSSVVNPSAKHGSSSGLIDYLKVEKSRPGVSVRNQYSQPSLSGAIAASLSQGQTDSNQQPHRYYDLNNGVKLDSKGVSNSNHDDGHIKQQAAAAAAQTEVNSSGQLPSGKQTASNDRGDGSTASNNLNNIYQAQERLMMSHEEQLSQMTTLCKQEMKLLMAVRVNQKSFPEYVRTLEEILSDKGRAILLLKSKIDEYVNIANKQ